MTVEVPRPTLHDARACPCPKCDSELLAQDDGSTLTEDIAHQGETVAQALAKLERVLDAALAGYCRDVRLVVGGGSIRDEVIGHLRFLEAEGLIRSFREEGRNRGAVVVRVRG